MATDFGRLDEQYNGLQGFIPQSNGMMQQAIPVSPQQQGLQNMPIQQSAFGQGGFPTELGAPLQGNTPSEQPQYATVNPEIFDQVKLNYEQKQAKQKVMLDETRARLEASTKKQSSFGPTFLAVAAALSGNFGPAIQLEEQKRKTKIAKDVFPEMVKINELVNSGDLEGASALANVVNTSFGPRSPELAAFLGQVQSQLNVKQRELQDQRLVSKGYVRITPKDHPNYKLYQYMQELADAGTPLSTEMYKTLEQSSRPHQQMLNDRMVQTSPLTTESKVTPIAAIAQPADFENPVGLEVAAAHKINPTDLANIERGLPVTRSDGTIIQPGSKEAQDIRNDFTGLQPQLARLELAKRITLEPGLQAQMLADGVDLWSMATADFRGKMSPALAGHMQRQAQTAAETVKQTSAVDPAMAQKMDMVFWDAKKGPEFGRPVISTLAQAQASGGAIQHARRDDYSTKMIPAMQAKRSFEGLPQMLSLIQKEVGWGGRITAGIKQELSNKFGIAVEEGQEVAQALRMGYKSCC